MSSAFLRRLSTRFLTALLLSLPLAATTLYAQQSARLHGTVHDPLGAVVTNASVDLIHSDEIVASTKTDDKGAFRFEIAASVDMKFALPLLLFSREQARWFISRLRVKLN